MPMADIVDYCANQLPGLLRVLAGSDVEQLDVQDGETRVRIHRTRATVEQRPEEAVAELAVPAEPAIAHVRSPLVGTFYRAAEPGAPPLADVGTSVQEDTVVGYVEVLGESIEVPAGVEGVIAETLATDGDAVDYGRPLFVVQPGG
jgi:acetyl-CoA carboxylase biotin carboxyl carrier protein